MTRYIHNPESEFSSRPSVAAGEREPGQQIASTSVVCSDAKDRAAPGSRLRYVAERGGGSAGTVYNRLDWEVLDQDAPAGRRVMCRATFKNAQAIAAALNRC